MRIRDKFMLVPLLFLFFCVSTLRGQRADLFVIASAGDYNTSLDGFSYSVSWTLGETFTETFQGAKKRLTQGFQQADAFIKDTVVFPLSKETLSRCVVHVYPNPVTDRLYVQIPQTNGISFRLEVLNIQGKTLTSVSSTDLSVPYPLDFGLWESGIYMLRIKASNADKKTRTETFERIYKIIKYKN